MDALNQNQNFLEKSENLETLEKSGNLETIEKPETIQTLFSTIVPVVEPTKNLKKVKSDDCIELKNIKYKSMLMNGNALQESKHSNNLSNLEKFLEDDKNNSQNEPWSKLDKTAKTRKLLAFADVYSKEKNFTEEETQLLNAFLRDCLDRKKLQRVKDVDYDKTTGEVKMVSALSYNKNTKHFTLKNIDKRISTLKSLPPKKARGTIKNTVPTENSDSDAEGDDAAAS